MPLTTSQKQPSLARTIAELFRTNGYDRTSVARIAAATGMLKGSLYHHFPDGKKAMARAALQSVADDFGQTQSNFLGTDESPRIRLAAWSRYLSEFYSQGNSNCILGSFVLSGGLTHFSGELKLAFSSWIDKLSQVLMEDGMSEPAARRRAQAVIERIQGALILARALEDFSNFQELMSELPDLLLQRSP